MTTRITYVDGSTLDIARIVPAALLDVEEELGVDALANLSQQRVFLRSLHRTAQLRNDEQRDFRDWVIDVDNVENVDDEPTTSEGSDPTPATTPSPDDSPT